MTDQYPSVVTLGQINTVFLQCLAEDGYIDRKREIQPEKSYRNALDDLEEEEAESEEIEKSQQEDVILANYGDSVLTGNTVAANSSNDKILTPAPSTPEKPSPEVPEDEQQAKEKQRRRKNRQIRRFFLTIVNNYGLSEDEK